MHTPRCTLVNDYIEKDKDYSLLSMGFWLTIHVILDTGMLDSTSEILYVPQFYASLCSCASKEESALILEMLTLKLITFCICWSWML